jgi:hypothetical protein
LQWNQGVLDESTVSRVDCEPAVEPGSRRERQYLGEYYTPERLAAMMCDRELGTLEMEY